MRISHGTRFTNQAKHNGYGYATERMLDSLSRLGYEVNQNDPTAEVEIWFDQPQHWKWSNPEAYHIGYHPWESTELLPGWLEIMNACDEIWTPSPLIAEWYAKAGITVPIYVYEHGVDRVWTEKKRVVDGPFEFLHVGFEAARKGGVDTMTAFRKAFRGSPDYRLTLKMVNAGWKVPEYGHLRIMNDKLGINELVELFHNSHAFVYPSRGEGFGLTPLQAMATGMPTITVPAWAPYKEYLIPNLSLPATLAISPWEEIHPGKIFRISQDDVIDRMRDVVENYDTYHEVQLAMVEDLRVKYDWDRLTSQAFKALESRLN